jgi:hypothetical protein
VRIRDGDSLYVYFKDDGNCCGRGSGIWVQGLSADGLAAVGPPILLVANKRLSRQGGRLGVAGRGSAHDGEAGWRLLPLLFGQFLREQEYSVAYLKCATPRGPCTDLGENPILWRTRKRRWSDPATNGAGRGAPKLRFLHGWNEDPDARERPGVHKRCLYVSRLYWDRPAGAAETRPRIAGGEPSVQPAD